MNRRVGNAEKQLRTLQKTYTRVRSNRLRTSAQTIPTVQQFSLACNSLHGSYDIVSACTSALVYERYSAGSRSDGALEVSSPVRQCFTALHWRGAFLSLHPSSALIMHWLKLLPLVRCRNKIPRRYSSDGPQSFDACH